jgi:predicted TIM-barrel fold metal-dependent hydrolase
VYAPLPSGWDCHVHLFDAAEPAAGAHYQPVHRPLSEIEALARAHGCGHLVLVQPSVYGADNALLLRGLAAGAGRHRGVVVLQGSEGVAELEDMHAAGVRGVRFNLVSPVGSARGDAYHQLRAWEPVLRALGWHVQWYTPANELPRLAQAQADCGLPFVLDHLAGLTPQYVADEPIWAALAQLAAAKSWIKLSGWYRLQAQAPYGALHPVIRRVARLFGPRMVWGSDWPHTSFPPEQLPGYASLWEPVVRVLGEELADGVREAGSALYA